METESIKSQEQTEPLPEQVVGDAVTESEEVFCSPYGDEVYVLRIGTGREGLYQQREIKDELHYDFISMPVQILALVRDTQNMGWGKLIEFNDMDNNRRECIISYADIGRDCESIIKRLRDEGLFITTNNGLAKRLVDYIHNVKPPNNRRIRFSPKTGWYGESFLLQNECIGTQDEELVYKNPGSKSIVFDKNGTLEDWNSNLSFCCSGNPILGFSVSTSFAAPLLHLLGMENGGFHLVGDSSIGKSTALLAAASVYGNPKIITQRWNATVNAMEGIAKAYNDMLMPIDEIGQSVAAHIGEIVYMLGNGSGKGRANVLGEARQRVKFQTLFLSNGEKTLEGHMSEAGRKCMAGMEVRLVNIPADCGEYGIYSDLLGYDDSHTFNEMIRECAYSHYGTAFPAFIEKVVEKRLSVIKATRKLIDKFVAEHVDENASGQVKRVVQRFGLVAAAGKLATAWGITGWSKTEADYAATFCFNKWLEQRGGVERAEETRLLSQVRAFFEAHAESRFTESKNDGTFRSDTYQRTTVNRVGFRKKTEDGMNYCVFPEQFRTEICKGFDAKTSAEILAKHGLLKKGNDGKPQIPCSIPGETKKKRMYIFTSLVIADHESTNNVGSEGNQVLSE